MPGTLRVVLTPLSGSAELSVVRGAAVSLRRFGAGSTGAKRDAALPAKLSFSVVCIQRVRPPREAGEPEPLLTIEGELTLLGRPARPVFRVSAPPTELDSGEPLDAPPEASPPRRVLQLAFDPEVFPELDAGLQLILPKRLEGSARFLEISAALEVSGAAEAAAENNDVLDVPFNGISPPVVPAFSLRVLDDVGAPLEGLELTFAFEGQETALTTNQDGLARIHGLPAVLALARFPDAKTLKGRLAPLWDTVRPINRKTEAAERIALGGDIEARVL